MAATIVARGISNVSDFAFDAARRLLVTRASDGAHRGSGPYVLTPRNAGMTGTLRAKQGR